ncbi:MAG TPA: DUF3048 domain-containing protein [Terriglobales bacterium]|nr:DUF3048 domain-containing protein [Terriglobales bacterium]
MTPRPSPTSTESVNLGYTEGTYDSFPVDVDPLTGLRVSDPAILDRRPVSVKISNFPRSNRPQWGLSLADIVYEYYHNNDLTRFHAIFYEHDASLAGPIRSGRLFDSYLMHIYDSLLVFASADSRVLDRFASEQLPWRLFRNLEGVCPPDPVCRYAPDAQNFLLTDTSTIGKNAVARGGDNDRPDLHGMAFGQQVPLSGTPLGRVYVYYSYSAYSYWDYDPSSGRYLRFEDTQEDLGGRGEAYAPLTDRLTGQQIGAENIVVLFVPHFHYFYSPATDTQPATEVVDMDFTGQGPAYAFRDGQAYEMQWVYEEGQIIYLVGVNGERYPFKPGTTFFEVVNDDSTIEKLDNSWRFKFVFRRP